jgi:ABC-2 type transport system permease protein
MSALGLAWEQFRFERKLFWRNPSAAFFNFLLPLLLLVLIGSAYGGDDDDLTKILIPGIAGMSVMASTFTSLAYQVTYLREEGILKRVRGTPLPTPSFLGGMVGSAVANAFVQVALVVVIGALAFGADWPAHPLSLLAFTALGVVCFGALGVAFAHAIPNVDSGPAYVNAVFLPLIFISGVFYSAESLPAVLEVVGEALPLKHLIDCLSYAIAGGDYAVAAPAVVAGWTLAGLVLAVRFFKWD